MDLKTATAKCYGLLELKHRGVGIKLVRSASGYDAFEATELIRPLKYCGAVKSAMAGSRVKQSRETSECKGANRGLGIEAPLPQFLTAAMGTIWGFS